MWECQKTSELLRVAAAVAQLSRLLQDVDWLMRNLQLAELETHGDKNKKIVIPVSPENHLRTRDILWGQLAAVRAPGNMERSGPAASWHQAWGPRKLKG